MLIDVRMFFWTQPLLLKGLHIYYFEICELFWYVKMKNGVIGQILKTLDTKWAHIKNATVNELYI